LGFSFYHQSDIIDIWRKLRVLKIIDNERDYVEDEVVEDKPFTINVNSVNFASLMVLNKHLRELVLGHLYTNRLIKGLNDIQDIWIEDDTAYVQVDPDIDPLDILEQKDEIMEHAADDSFISVFKENKGLPYVPRITIKKVMNELNNRSEIFDRTGGTHAALLYHKSEVVSFAEDVGRFNAVDKVIGMALCEGALLKESILATSGRLAGEMALKATWAGVPVVCSVSAPLATGVRIAKASGLTLIGFARGNRLNVYSGYRRLAA